MFCRSCGGENAPTARFCGKCGAPLAAAPAAPPPQYAAPAAPPWPAVPPPPQYTAPAAPPLASLGRRTVAVILDSFVLAAAYGVIGTAVARRYGGVTGSGFSMEGGPALLTIGITLLAGFFYYWLFEGLFSATLGKAMLGVSVRRTDGGPCGLGKSLIRNLLRLIDGIGVYLVGFLVAVFSKSKQRIGDHAASTIVVLRPSGAAVRVLLVLAWFVLLGAGFTAAWLLHRGAASGFAVVDFAFLQSKGGPPRVDAPYKPGDTVYVKFGVAGFENGPGDVPDFTVRVTPLDPNGLPLFRTWEDRTAQAPTQRTVGFTFNFELPAFAPPGRYRFDIRGRDAVAAVDAALAPEFTVDAPSPVPADRLEMRNIRFSSTKGGPREDPFIVRGGGTLHLAAEIAGVRFRQDQPDVRVAFQLLDPNGNVLYEKPDYLVFTEAQAYRPPGFFTSMTGWLTLPSGARPGQYTVRLTVTDQVSGETATYEPAFQVE